MSATVRYGIIGVNGHYIRTGKRVDKDMGVIPQASVPYYVIPTFKILDRSDLRIGDGKKPYTYRGER